MASQITSTSAKLSAIINPAGESTSYSMQIGTSKKHQTTLKGGNLAARATPKGVVISARHLKANRTYHFRIAAKNTTGTSYGQEVTFRTRKAARARPGPSARDKTNRVHTE